MKKNLWIVGLCVIGILAASAYAFGRSSAFGDKIFDFGHMKSLDSDTKLSEGDAAPDFDLPAISGNRVRLSEYRGNRHVMLTFIPAAWTPVCSDQWPGYHIARELFEDLDTVVIGISCDNLPSLHAWILEMGGVWFDVVSDFWPHGKVSDAYGVLRSDGMSERAVFIIDKTGIIRFIHLEDINARPDLGVLIQALEELTP
ncbi:MAG TPA: peroxiredoxin [Desulfotignum sp.]|nr:peroxiredoxin [Desulfotignum sp.]